MHYRIARDHASYIQGEPTRVHRDDARTLSALRAATSTEHLRELLAGTTVIVDTEFGPTMLLWDKGRLTAWEVVTLRPSTTLNTP